MKTMDYKSEYRRWCELVTEYDIKKSLEKYDEIQIEDAFYRDLSFGTGGLRGLLGAGTNRMNIYTVAKVSQGLADYVLKKYGERASVTIGYDSRIKSDLFAKTAASVFAANLVSVNFWPRLLPVPLVSYATRYLHTSVGVMVTASHNPSEYNGYKVYDFNGCQITTEVAEEILSEIEKLDIFADVKKMDFEEAINKGLIKYIPEIVLDSFIEQVKNQSVLYGEEVDKNVSIVYSPLNGTGLEPVTRVLNEQGFKNVTIVEEQRQPDGNFPTCPYPNPEVKETLALGLEYCKRCNADLLIATDPDCDRVGIAVKNAFDEYQLLSGNEIGMLLLDYICSQKKKHGKLPENPLLIKTIVTTDMADYIARNYGLATLNVLTGFKFIGEQIGFLEEKGEEDRFVFGFEESYGYLTGGYVRDKDAVGGVYIICEMFSYYKTHSVNLLDKLDELYAKYGYCLNTMHCFEFDGSAGMTKMDEIMKLFREKVGVGYQFAEKKINSILDYSKGLDSLPKSNVLKYLLNGNCSVVVRPSGTEPKLKIYISVSAKNKIKAKEDEIKLIKELSKFIK